MECMAPEREETTTDEALVAQVLGGEAEVFAELYQRYYTRAYRLAYGMTGHRGAAEELTQEIFMRVYERLHLFRGESRFATWFYRLAVNQSLNYRRRERSERYEETAGEKELDYLASEQPGIEADLMQKQTQLQVHRAMLGLKPKLRMMVILKDIEGLSYEEIAARTNCSTGTVASRLNRARKLLARKLEHLKGVY